MKCSAAFFARLRYRSPRLFGSSALIFLQLDKICVVKFLALGEWANVGKPFLDLVGYAYQFITQPNELA